MSNSNGLERVGVRRQSPGQSVVSVYERLSGQNRWTGVAYDAVSGSVVATASRGTRSGTRIALERALPAPPYGGLDQAGTERGGRWTRPAPQAGRRRRDPILRQVESLIHTR